jgi:hypothetical protein
MAPGPKELSHRSTNLNSDEIEDFRKLRKALTTIKNKFLEIAVRRFGFAGDRENVEDRLVDLVIAMVTFPLRCWRFKISR